MGLMQRRPIAARPIGHIRGSGIRQQAPIAAMKDEDPLSSDRNPEPAMCKRSFERPGLSAGMECWNYQDTHASAFPYTSWRFSIIG